LTRGWILGLGAVVGVVALYVALDARSSVAALADVSQAMQINVAELSATFDAYDDQLDAAVSGAVTSAQQAMDAYAETKISATNSALNQSAYQALEDFRLELANLRAEVDAAEEALQTATRELNGRPPYVSFEAAFEASRSLTRATTSSGPASYFASTSSVPVVEFHTSVGSIKFAARDFAFEWVPSTGEPAWFRLGKAETTENSELIQAFIDQAQAVKRAEGYAVATNRTVQTDYGEARETLLRSGDLYFRTWFQFQRVQGTYDRFSLQYTYYVESGVETRRARAQEERYAQYLGN